MTINYGKRKANGLTASNPGETLYIPFATYNDSGASIAPTGFATTDIEIFKNGGAVARATDSGYSLVSDTGQYGNTIGLNRFSIQPFNTSDDTGFFDEGSQYHVAVSSISVDGRTVSFFAAVFELGVEEVNVARIDGDTGAADVLQKALAGQGDKLNANLSTIRANQAEAQKLGRFAGRLSDTGTYDTGTGFLDTGDFLPIADTGAIATAVWAKDTRVLTANTNLAGLSVNIDQVDGDTGAADRMGKWAETKLAADGSFDTGTGILQGSAASVDTGAVNNAVWNGARADHVTAGSFGQYVNSNLEYIDADTGKATHLGQMADEYDTGRLPAEASATVDTGSVSNAVWNSTRAAHTTAGTFGQYVNADADLINGDTGAAAHLAQMADEYDTGRLPADAVATTDTGAIATAVWSKDVRTLTQTDTGAIRTAVIGVDVNVEQIDGDTGAALGLMEFANLLNSTGQIQSSTLSVNAITQTSIASSAIGASQLSTDAVAKIVDGVWDENDTGHGDTGTYGRLRQGVNVTKINDDTGSAQVLQTALAGQGGVIAANMSQIRASEPEAQRLGRFAGRLSDTGTYDTGTGFLDTGDFLPIASSSADTGAIATAVWGFNSRVLTQTDTGAIQTSLQNLSVNVEQIDGDTGAANVLQKATSGTGSVVTTNVATIRGSVAEAQKLGRWAGRLQDTGLFDTGQGIAGADIKRVNAVTVTGTGDTGTSDTWRPA